MLEPFAKKVISHIGRGNEMALWKVGEFMKKQRGFNDRAKEAGINMKSNIANFLRALPERFTVTTSSERRRGYCYNCRLASRGPAHLPVLGHGLDGS